MVFYIVEGNEERNRYQKRSSTIQQTGGVPTSPIDKEIKDKDAEEMEMWKIDNPDAPWNLMYPRERIDYIRYFIEEYGLEDLRKLMNLIFAQNKYKPIRERYWVEAFKEGKTLVRALMRNFQKIKEGCQE